MDRTILVADDYTGAADAGIHFLATGEPVTLVLPGAGMASFLRGSRGVLSFDTETRFLPPDEAADVVLSIFRHCREAGFARFFKKIDSTLRGNVGTEIEAALTATGLSAAVVAHAFPAMGRTCANGIAYVNGVPLKETEFGHDRFTPIASSRVAGVIGTESALPAGHLPLSLLRGDRTNAEMELSRLMATGVKVIVADSETEEDLDVVAAMITADPNLLPAGSSGLSRALVKTVLHDAERAAAPCRMRGRVLAVIGSLSPTAVEQMGRALDSGRYGLVTLDVQAARNRRGEEFDRIVREALALGNKHVVINARTCGDIIDISLGMEVAHLMGEAVDRLLTRGGFGTLFSTGGSTSAGITRTLGLDRITLEREILPGVVAGRFFHPGDTERWFVSKAGGFSGRNTLLSLLDFVE